MATEPALSLWREASFCEVCLFSSSYKSGRSTMHRAAQSTKLGMRMAGVIHCQPSNFQSKSGQKTGVGKNADECVGCQPAHADPRLRVPRAAVSGGTRSKETRKEHDEAMGDIVEMMHILRDRRFRRCAVTEIGLFRNPSKAATYRIPNEKRSGAMPITKASQKLDRLFRPKAIEPQRP